MRAALHVPPNSHLRKMVFHITDHAIHPHLCGRIPCTDEKVRHALFVFRVNRSSTPHNLYPSHRLTVDLTPSDFNQYFSFLGLPQNLWAELRFS